MNRGKGEWWDWTWNPFTGCTAGCEYCYARGRWELSFQEKHGPFKPMVWPNRFDEPCRKKTPAVIFTVSMGDVFDPGFSNDDRDRLLSTIGECDRHAYVILTKNVKGLLRYARHVTMHDEQAWPLNLWVGVSVTRAHDVARIHGLRIAVPKGRRIVCFEPLLEPIETELTDIDWVMIGGQTGRQKIVPDVDWIEAIAAQARRDKATIWIKANAGLSRHTLRQIPDVMTAGLRAALRRKLIEGR